MLCSSRTDLFRRKAEIQSQSISVFLLAASTSQGKKYTQFAITSEEKSNELNEN